MSEDEIYQQKAIIYSNTVTAMVVLLRGMNTLGLKLEDPSREVKKFLQRNKRFSLTRGLC